LLRKPDAWWSFQLGEWLYQAGRYRQARKYLIAARDLDPERNRASSSVNGLIRDVARAHHLVLLNLEDLISAGAPHGIPGWESFEDNQHVRDSYAEAAKCLAMLGYPQQTRTVPEPNRASNEREPTDLKAENENLSPLLDRALSQVLTAAPFQQRSAIAQLVRGHLPLFIAEGEDAIHSQHRKAEEEALVLSAMGEAFWDAGLRSRAIQLNAKARLLCPRDGELYLQQAIFLLRAGEKAQAISWLRKALALYPGHGEAQFFLNRLERI
jgi:tetratricopeptide (TPR) repeat protein